MTSADVEVMLIAAAWASGVGVVGLAVAWLGRSVSLRWLPVGVALVAVGSVVAGVIGTSRAMFFSDHDYQVTLLVCLVAGLVSFGFALLVGSRVVRGSSRLREHARSFGESGEYAGEVAGPAEFTHLNAELHETSRRLAESRARAQQLEDSRRELVSWVSHDLRTPLAGMRAMAEALEDGLVDDPARYHRQIRTEVDRTVRMVDDLFELSQIHAGLLVPVPVTVALADLVNESLVSAESVAAAKGVRLGGHVDDGLLVNADPVTFSRVIANLVMNAIRHTPEGGEVVVDGHRSGDWVELSVRDRCGGIPSTEIGRVFEVAFRGEQARTPDPNAAVSGGAGLGLAIVRGIVEAHRGQVAVDNVVGGCRFLVQVPAPV